MYVNTEVCSGKWRWVLTWNAAKRASHSRATEAFYTVRGFINMCWVKTQHMHFFHGERNPVGGCNMCETLHLSQVWLRWECTCKSLSLSNYKISLINSHRKWHQTPQISKVFCEFLLLGLQVMKLPASWVGMLTWWNNFSTIVWPIKRLENRCGH